MVILVFNCRFLFTAEAILQNAEAISNSNFLFLFTPTAILEIRRQFQFQIALFFLIRRHSGKYGGKFKS